MPRTQPLMSFLSSSFACGAQMHASQAALSLSIYKPHIPYRFITVLPISQQIRGLHYAFNCKTSRCIAATQRYCSQSNEISQAATEKRQTRPSTRSQNSGVSADLSKLNVHHTAILVLLWCAWFIPEQCAWQVQANTHRTNNTCGPGEDDDRHLNLVLTSPVRHAHTLAWGTWTTCDMIKWPPCQQ